MNTKPKWKTRGTGSFDGRFFKPVYIVEILNGGKFLPWGDERGIKKFSSRDEAANAARSALASTPEGAQ